MAEQRVERVVAADHPALDGHFPGDPIVPGVVLVDLAFEAACGCFGGMRLLGVPSVKFVSALRPGEAFAIVLERPRPDRIDFRCERAGKVLVQGRLTVADRVS